MGVSATSQHVPQRSIFCERSFAKHPWIVVFASIFRKLRLVLLPLLLALAAPSLPSTYVHVASTYIHVANRLFRLLNGCNVSLNLVFLILNSIIAAIAATSKLSRERTSTVTVHTPEIELRGKGESVQHKAQQLSLRPTEQNSDISAVESKPLEAIAGVGVEEQEHPDVSDGRHVSEDCFMTPASPVRCTATKEVLNESFNPMEQEPKLLQQATTGDSIDEIWRQITDKCQRHSSDRQVDDSRSHVCNPAVRQQAPALTGLARLPNSYSRCEYEMRVVPELNSKSLGREPSTGLEELNRKAEEFIARFSEQIRLQRQRSIIRCMRVVNRAILS